MFLHTKLGSTNTVNNLPIKKWAGVNAARSLAFVGKGVSGLEFKVASLSVVRLVNFLYVMEASLIVLYNKLLIGLMALS